MINRVAFLVLVILLTVVGGGLSFGCFSSEEDIFYVAGIPDQNVGELTRQYDRFTEKLGEELGVTVKYVPTIDYAATVLAFARGDVHLAWFGGLTGVQARILVPGSIAIAQRARDAEFHSVFIHNTSVEVKNLSDLQGLRFSFGDENSTSGHLMPRHFLLEAGINADVYFDGAPMYSGSHDKTWLLVQGGGAQAGALSEAVWEKALEQGKVDSAKVRVFFTTPPYFDYNWTVHPDSDDLFGEGFIERVQSAIMTLNDPEILRLFSADSFIESSNSNYRQIEDIARSLDIIR
jgi:phosphonate transport system substrate-binding protein